MGFQSAAKCFGRINRAKYKSQHRLGPITERNAKCFGIFHHAKVYNVVYIDQG